MKSNMGLLTVLTNTRRVQLLYAPLLLSTPNNLNKLQRRRAANKRVPQSFQAICEKYSLVSILAREGMGAHERPVDIGRYDLAEESGQVDIFGIVEEVGDLAFGGIFGGGGGFILDWGAVLG